MLPLLTPYSLSTCHAYGWLGYAWRPGQSLGEVMGEAVAAALDGPPTAVPPPGGAAVRWSWLLLGGLLLTLCTSAFCARGRVSPRRI